jgi:hypothetical protein
MVTLDAFWPAVRPVDGPFECIRRELIGESGIGRELYGPGALAITAAVPNDSAARAIITVKVDSAGKVFQYAERRGPPIRLAAPPGLGAPAAQGPGAEPGRTTTIFLDYSSGHATVSNHGGGGRDEAASGPVDQVAHESKFGVPATRAARVVAQCRTPRADKRSS